MGSDIIHMYGTKTKIFINDEWYYKLTNSVASVNSNGSMKHHGEIQNEFQDEIQDKVLVIGDLKEFLLHLTDFQHKKSSHN